MPAADTSARRHLLSAYSGAKSLRLFTELSRSRPPLSGRAAERIGQVFHGDSENSCRVDLGVRPAKSLPLNPQFSGSQSQGLGEESNQREQSRQRLGDSSDPVRN